MKHPEVPIHDRFGPTDAHFEAVLSVSQDRIIPEIENHRKEHRFANLRSVRVSRNKPSAGSSEICSCGIEQLKRDIVRYAKILLCIPNENRNLKREYGWQFWPPESGYTASQDVQESLTDSGRITDNYGVNLRRHYADTS